MADHEQQVNSKLITYEQLAENFHLPINEVSKKLGICTTVLKKVCRRNGIPRWPYRKLKAIDKKISNLKTSLQKNPQESKRIHAEIVALQERKRLIMENPSCLSTEPATNNDSTTPTTFDEAYDDLNSSALLLSLTPNRDTQSPEPRASSQPSPPKVPRLSFSAGRTEEEEEELLVASNLVELMSQHTFGGSSHNSSNSANNTPVPRSSSSSSALISATTTTPNPPPQRSQTTTHLPLSLSSYQPPTLFTSSNPSLFSSSHPVPSFPSLGGLSTSNSSPPPNLPLTARPSSTSPPPFPNMPMINPRSFFSPEERAPPIPHAQNQAQTPFKPQLSPTISPTPSLQKPSHLRSFSSAPIIETILGDESQPPLPSWFSRSLEEAVGELPPTSVNSSIPPSQLQQQQSPLQKSEPKGQQPQPQPKVSPLLQPTQQQLPRPETPSGTKRAGRDVETLEAESRTQNSLTTKRSRNQSPALQALGLPSFILANNPPTVSS